MLQSANYLNEQLESIIQRALAKHPEYGLVLTGHSLGAGAAALLSIILRPIYPQLQCFAFSPPGGLISSSAAEYTESFCLSVIVGHDLVPRLSLPALEKLMNQVECALQNSPLPKVSGDQRLFIFYTFPLLFIIYQFQYRIFRVGCQRIITPSIVSERKEPYYVHISHIKSTSQFWVQRKGDTKCLISITKQLDDLNSLVEQVVLGKMYAAKHPEFGSLCRIIVNSISESSVQVHFVDYGHLHTVAIEEIHEIPANFLKIKPLAVKCSLEQSPGQNTSVTVDEDKNIEEFKKILSNGICQAVLGDLKVISFRVLPISKM